MTDIDKLKKLAETLKTGVALGEKIAKDGIGAEDLVHAPEAVAFLVELYGSAKDIKEMGEEAKDVDALEAIELVKIILS
jgi:hypothetical protein